MAKLPGSRTERHRESHSLGSSIRARLWPAPKRPIVLISAAGMSNYGDDLLLKYWLGRYPTDSVTVVSFGALEAIPLGQAKTLSIIEAIQNPARFAARLKAEGARLVHLTGGGYCNDLFNSARPLSQLLRCLAPAARLIATGVSFHPIEAKSIRSLRRIPFDVLSVRDMFSLRSAGRDTPCAILAGDDAQLIPTAEFLRPPTEAPPRMIVCWQDQFVSPTVPEEAAKVIAILAKQLQLQELTVLDLCPGDGTIATFLGAFSPKIVSREEALRSGLPIRPCDTVVTTRFHPRLLSERAGARTLGVALNDYYANKHELDGPAVIFQGRAVGLHRFLRDGACELLLAPRTPHTPAIDVPQSQAKLETSLIQVYSRTNTPQRIRRELASFASAACARRIG